MSEQDRIDLFNQRKYLIAYLATQVPGKQEAKTLVAMEAYRMLVDGNSMHRIIPFIDSSNEVSHAA